MCFPHVVDRNQWFRVFPALQWDSDREELARLTGVRPPTPR